MIKQFYKKILLRFIPFILLLNCSSPTEVNYIDSVYIAGIPVIKGYFVTTNENPDGTGEVIGNPDYKIKAINIFPNPFIDNISTFIHVPVYVTFNHLPANEVTIYIVKGISEYEYKSLISSSIGASYKSGVTVIKKIIKNHNGQFVVWDLEDEDGNLVLTGLYRTYFFGKGIPDNYHLDVSIDYKIVNNY